MWVIKLCFSFVISSITISKTEEVQEFKIGGLFQDDNEEIAFNLAANLLNNQRNSSLKLLPNAVQTSSYNAHDVFLKACTLLRQGVIGVFGPSSLQSSTYIQAICDRKEIPQIETHWNPHLERSNCLVNLHPHPSVLSNVFSDMIFDWGWRNLVVIYENNESLLRVGPILTLNTVPGHYVILKQLETDEEGNYRPVLTSIKNTAIVNFLLDCSIDILEEVLKQAQQVGLMTEEYNYIITNLDIQTIDLAPFQYAGANITGVRLVNPENKDVIEIAKEIQNFRQLNGKTAESFDVIAAWKMRLKTALTFDAVKLFHETIKDLTASKFAINSKPLYCNTTDNWENGYTIINYMKGKSIKGLSGHIKFDNEGFRKDFSVDIVELALGGLIKIGTWNSTCGLNISRIYVPEVQKVEEGSLANKTFVVITCLTEPYGMLKETTTQLTGNDRFEGYGMDLIQELSQMLGFNYTFTVQKDGDNGSFNETTGKWSGLLGAIIDGKADLAIADLTVTSEREQAVDFTTLFMNLGISILYKKPEPVPPSLFMFASPFSIQVWALLGVSYFLVSLSFFVMGRISPSEWTNPYPCVEEPEYLVNQFSLKNSLWFTVGSLMQQGTEIAPISISTRTAAGIWWFFTLIMVSTYTASLASFLTVETLVTSFNSIEELVKQTEINYGAKRGGATANFFRDSNDTVKRKIWQFMTGHPEYMMENNQEGVEKVQKENYAYFMESTTIEYVIERHCTLARVGGQLDDKGYAIALKKNSPYRNDLTSAILLMQESGRLAFLKNKWWKEKRGAGNCDIKQPNAATSLDLKNVGGVFLVLFLGSIVGVFGSFLEMLFKIYRRSKHLKVTFKEELKSELKFFFKFTQNLKKFSSKDNLDSSKS